jgi:hypothetical protein
MSTMMRRVPVILAAIGAVLLVGCGNDPEVVREDSTSSTTASTTTTEPPTDAEAVRQYFDALATQEPSEMEKMTSAAAPESPAALYAVHQSASTQSYISSGAVLQPQTTSYSKEEVTVCGTDTADDPEVCTTFSGFVVDDSGLLTDFKVNDEELAPRLGTTDQGELAGPGVTVRLVSAYRSVQSGDLMVVVSATAGSGEVELESYSASFVAEDGTQYEAAAGTGPSDLRAGATATFTSSFAGAPLGGRYIVDLLTPLGASASYESGTVEIPIRPAF